MQQGGHFSFPLSGFDSEMDPNILRQRTDREASGITQQQKFPCSLIHDVKVRGGMWDQDQLSQNFAPFEDVLKQFQINLAGLVIHTWTQSQLNRQR